MKNLPVIILFILSLNIPFLYSQKKSETLKSHIIKNFTIYEKDHEYYAWPSAVKAANGDIIVVFTETEEHLGPDGRIILARSKDNGRTWEKPQTIYNTIIDDRESGLTKLKDGRIMSHYYSTHWKSKNYLALPKEAYYPEVIKRWSEYVDKPEYKNSAALQGAYTSISSDNGYTWSKPLPGPDAIHGGVELSDRSILVVSYRDFKNSFGIFKAERAGDKWTVDTLKCPIFKDFGFGEPHVLQLPGGRIIIMIRTTASRPYDNENFRNLMWETYSDDNGKTWSEFFPTPIWGYPPHLLLLSDGRVLCTYGYRRVPYGERACISKDGITWIAEDEIILRDDGPNFDLGYPASVEIEPGKILTVYYQVNAKVSPLDKPPAPERKLPGIYGTIWNIPKK